MKPIIRELLILFVTIIPFNFLLFYGDEMPEKVPIHWDFKGEIDNYSSPWIFPFINLLLYFLLLIIPQIDPRKKNFELWKKQYFRLRLLCLLFTSGLFLIINLNAMGYHHQWIHYF